MVVRDAASDWSRKCRKVTGRRPRLWRRSWGLTTPLGGDGPIDGRWFLAYVRQHLATTLRPGDIVVMDNLSSHNVAGVQQAIEAVGAQGAYLTPYSPDFNPIEQVFTKLKSLVRSVQQCTVDGLGDLLDQLLDRFPALECRNYLRNTGYSTGV